MMDQMLPDHNFDHLDFIIGLDSGKLANTIAVEALVKAMFESNNGQNSPSMSANVAHSPTMIDGHMSSGAAQSPPMSNQPMQSPQLFTGSVQSPERPDTVIQSDIRLTANEGAKPPEHSASSGSSATASRSITNVAQSRPAYQSSYSEGGIGQSFPVSNQNSYNQQYNQQIAPSYQMFNNPYNGQYNNPYANRNYNGQQYGNYYGNYGNYYRK